MPKTFRILDERDPKLGIPWKMIQPHQSQALVNHGQTLVELDNRGGLTYAEAFYVLTDQRFAGNHSSCKALVRSMIEHFQASEADRIERGAQAAYEQVASPGEWHTQLEQVKIKWRNVARHVLSAAFPDTIR